MKLKYSSLLLILTMALYIGQASAQKKKQVKKPAAKTAAKPAAKKPAAKKPATVPASKTAAKKLGDAVAAAAQDTSKKGKNDDTNTTLSEEIIVTTAYKPVLADAVKIRRNPDLEDKSPFKAPLTYAPIDKRLERNTEIRQLEAEKMPAERDSDLNNNYVKVGLGNMKTTFAEAYINNGRDAALQAGAYFKHLAQSSTDFSKQNQAHEEAGVFGKSIGATNTLTGRITYNRLSNYFYGYDKLNPPAKLDVAHQAFNTIGAEGELTKNFKDVERDFTYALKLNGYIFSDAFKARENNVVVTGYLNQTVKQFYAGLSGSLDFSTQKDSLYSRSNNLAKVNPYLKFEGTNYKIDAGVNIVSEFGASRRFYVFPAAKAEYQVIPKYVRIYVEAKGDINRSSLRDWSNVNPYLGQNLTIKNSVDILDLAGGLKGTLAPGLAFKASVFRNTVKNLPLFVNNFNFTAGKNRFDVIYDNGNATISGFNGELDYKTSTDVNIFGRVEIKDYKLASEAQPWNLPKFLLTAGTVIHISNLITVNGSLLFRGDTKDRNPDGTATPVSISSFADISGGVEYKATKKISVFVQVNNLLNTRNQTWLYYPNYGFNIFGGVGFGF